MLIYVWFFFHFNSCSLYVCCCFYQKGLSCMFVKWSLSYIQLIDWFFVFTYICVLLLSIWIIVASMCVAVFTKSDLSACFRMIIIFYPVHWLILYLHLDLYVGFSFILLQASMFIPVDHEENQLLYIVSCLRKIVFSLSFILF